MMIEPISRNNIADSVYVAMLGFIGNGVWKESQKIPSENELKDSFQVSRNTVRQAIQKLSALGIVEARQGEGTFVKKVDMSFYINLLIPTAFLCDCDTMKILEFEKSIQVESVKLVAKRATNDEIEGLAAYIQRMEVAEDDASFFDADIAYHIYLSQITHNEMFYKSMLIIKDMIHQGLLSVVQRYGSRESVAYHQWIYEKLKVRDVVGAAELMDRHMGDVVEKLSKILNEEGISYVV